MVFQQRFGDGLVSSELLLQNEQQSFNLENRLFLIKEFHSLRVISIKFQECELHATASLLPLICIS